MVEFGEQLKRAREAKGMTQQSLAEQLYVTRQTVSRWENGNRYPDLLTTKKMSQVLEISMDDLLSEKELNKVVERNSVIENPFINNIMIALYAFIVLSLAVTVLDIIIRFPFQSDAIDFSDIQVIVINIVGLMMQIVTFTCGLISAVKGTLSPKRMGMVAVAFFASICLTDSNALFRSTSWQLFSVSFMIILPNILGAISSYQFFVKANEQNVFRIIIYMASSWGILRLVITNYYMIRYAGQFVSMNNALSILLKISIYILLIYQAYTLKNKRNRVFSTEEKS
ncbi:MAG: helix-turn-helix transcriptional regulator [Eubacteriales bacterium]|nr:helix-turn-helix transcriptional regulator [Eubacteriales bacterium]